MGDLSKGAEPPTCAKCGHEYTHDVDHEPTPLCHGCAHAFVDDAIRLLPKIRKGVRHHAWDARDATDFLIRQLGSALRVGEGEGSNG